MTTRDQIMREANFWASRAILTGAELDVFTLLEAEPLAAGEMARRMGADPRAVDRLLDALAALGFLEKKEALFSLSEKGKLLSSHHGETMRPLLLHFANLWQDWGKLAAVVKEGRPARRTGMKMDGASRKAFIGAMDAAGRDLSERIAGSFDGSRFRRLLDIGGASGTYTAAFLRKNPQMTAVLFDLPPVAAIARGRLRDEGMLDRVSLAAGDYKKGPVPCRGRSGPPFRRHPSKQPGREPRAFRENLPRPRARRCTAHSRLRHGPVPDEAGRGSAFRPQHAHQHRRRRHIHL